MDNPTQKSQATADTAEAETSEAAAELGKFSSVEALRQAYTALEAEFTRRSQKLKELEKANKEQTAPPAQAENGEVPSQQAEKKIQPGPAETLDERTKQAVIEEYLSGIGACRGVPIITGGSGVQAQRRVPENLREAGALAKNFLNNKEGKN